MKVIQYSNFCGLDCSTTEVVAPQVNFVKLDNYIPSIRKGGIVKRHGSKSYATTGDVWGIGGWKKIGTTPRVPTKEIVIRHRRASSISYFEKYNAGSDGWDSITLGAQTVFSTGDVTRFAQVGDLLAICGGRPAKIIDAGTGSISRLGGSAPASAPTLASGGAGAITGTYYYVYTLYDSTTGWESSPSPISTVFTASANTVTVTASVTTADREGVDKKRIYRTITTGEQPFLKVGEIALATTSYSDNTGDIALGASSPNIADHDPPPTSSYLCCSHLGRVWIASGNQVFYSKPYQTTLSDLEYFALDRTFTFPGYVTGLLVSPSGSLLVFCPPGVGVWEIRGRTPDEFVSVVYLSSEGTNYPSSICSREKNFVYWGDSGPRLVSDGNLIQGFGDSAQPYFSQFIDTAFDDDVFVWSVWSEQYKQFIFGLAGTIVGAGQWITEGGMMNQWEDGTTHNVVSWHT